MTTLSLKNAREAKRLEALWSGEFGNAYIERNKNGFNGRGIFWKAFLSRVKPKSVMEVGCNIGGNLRWIASILPPRAVTGIDINDAALRELVRSVPGVNAIQAPARDIPFKDGSFELVFTSGVLIHQPESSLKQVMSEVVRCSRRYVLALEYFAPKTEEVFYRGEKGALFKRDYGALYKKAFPGLKLVQKGELHRNEGWDEVTYWLFEKKRAK